MPELIVKCKTCGVWFATGINVDKESFRTLKLEANYHVCPKGHGHLYSKPDYLF